MFYSSLLKIHFILDARCVTLSDDKNDGLKVIREDPESVLLPYRDNVTITCTAPGRQLRNTVTSSFRQCVYDPKPVSTFNVTCIHENPKRIINPIDTSQIQLWINFL